MARLVNNERNKKVSKTVKLTSNKPKKYLFDNRTSGIKTSKQHQSNRIVKLSQVSSLVCVVYTNISSIQKLKQMK